MPVAVEETYSGNYIVVFDPIDGSANIDTSLTMGSIFGIYGPDKQCIFDMDDDSPFLLYDHSIRFFVIFSLMSLVVSCIGLQCTVQF